ncbi:MAG TPA: cadherin repeat domain-containing protein [Candidatus Marinimicrobia bacterium]|nr:cadherin repeat domain-containing protein [Candidatus Neomarinimicrobiota bacterium]
MIENIRFYFFVSFTIFFSVVAGQTENFQAVNDNILLEEDEAMLKVEQGEGILKEKVVLQRKNDKLTSRDNLDLKLLSKPSLGTVDQQGFNIFFTPNVNVNGVDEFQYMIDNGFSMDTARVKITIVSVNDVPTGVELINSTVIENGPDGALISQLTTIDPDLDDTFTYSFSKKRESDNEYFSIKDGFLYTNISFDYELRDSYTLLVRSKDKSNKKVTSELVVTVTNINEAPQFIDQKEMTITHLEGSGKIVAKLMAEDPDIDQDYVKYKIVGGDDKARFKILRDDELAFIRDPDFESPIDMDGDNTYKVTFRAVDSKDKMLFSDGSATIIITDEEEKIIESLDSRKYVAWTVDHMPYHILMEDAIIDYINLRSAYSADSDGLFIAGGTEETISELQPSDQIIIVQEKGNTEQIHEIWYGNGLDYTVIDRERVDWVLSQNIQQVLIDKNQYLTSESEIVFFKDENERLMAGYSSKFSVWHPNNFIMSLQSFSMRSNLIQYATNMSIGNELIGLPGALSGSTELGVATHNSEFGLRLPVNFDLGSLGSMKNAKYLSPDYLGLYSKVNIDNIFSSRTDFHALMGFSFYPKTIGSMVQDTVFFNTDSIEHDNRFINILDMYALMATTKSVPISM